MSGDKRISVDVLTRVEGEGALNVHVRDGSVETVELRIFEPPRFFEALLRGRHHSEAPDITARICGICPIAYQMSAVHAMEAALDVAVDAQIRALRRLIYCGEWIESHTLHIYMLHGPDFLGYDSAIEMARDHRGVVERGLQLKKAGNDLVALLGGREIHPINVRVGGFYRVPEKKELGPVAERLKWAREAARATVQWAAELPFTDHALDTEYVALRHPEEYPFNEGRVASTKGLDIPVTDWEGHVIEEQVPHSNALQATLRGRDPYLVGPLARYNLNFDRLSPLARMAAEEAGLGRECHNPFQSIVVRSVEVLYACDEALRLIEGYEKPNEPAAAVESRAGVGHACTEAPRGSLYHRYQIDEEGMITAALIVPPTSQNQRTVENDLRSFLEPRLALPEDELRQGCEHLIRNYDPCISCATHSLKIRFAGT